MSICYIFHSESGNTRGVIERCAAIAGGDKIEVKDLEHYNRITKFLRGGRRAVQGMVDPIEPSNIDVAKYDAVVIGSPVWGGHPTPAINAVIKSLKGCEGKKAVIMVTCGGNAGQSTEIMQKALEGIKMSVSGSMVFTRKDLRNQERMNSFVNLVKKASGA